MRAYYLVPLLLSLLSGCGGPVCKAGQCMEGQKCSAATDCQSGVCQAGACAAPSCTDGVKNGKETDTDCGGTCGKCADGKQCAATGDCQSGVCQAGACAAPSCTDGVKNGSETDKDCGGTCPNRCANMQGCAGAGDCQSGVCMANLCLAGSCMDGVKNGDETDKDCGGKSCLPCAPNQACLVPGDCTSSVCTGNLCQAPACNDGVKNGKETDKDCGGPDCGPCAVGQACAANSDCGMALCNVNKCYIGTSCADIHKLQADLKDGSYPINPDPTKSPYMVYCDMTRDDGGWTLILKANGDATLYYDSAYWTNTSLLNQTDVTVKSGNAKYQSFVDLKVTRMRGELVIPNNGGLFYKNFDGTKTAMQIFNGPIGNQNGLPYFQNGDDWSVQPNCQSFGVNMFYTPGSNNNASRSRMGWSANNENDCNTNDTAIGIGLRYGYGDISRGAGFLVFAGGNKGDRNVGADGLLWVK